MLAFNEQISSFLWITEPHFRRKWENKAFVWTKKAGVCIWRTDKFRTCWIQVTDVKDQFLKSCSSVSVLPTESAQDSSDGHCSMIFLPLSADYPVISWAGTLNCVFLGTPDHKLTSLERWRVATPCPAMILSRPQYLPSPGEFLRKLKWTFWKASKVWLTFPSWRNKA